SLMIVKVFSPTNSSSRLGSRPSTAVIRYPRPESIGSSREVAIRHLPHFAHLFDLRQLRELDRRPRRRRRRATVRAFDRMTLVSAMRDAGRWTDRVGRAEMSALAGRS